MKYKTDITRLANLPNEGHGSVGVIPKMHNNYNNHNDFINVFYLSVLQRANLHAKKVATIKRIYTLIYHV